MVKIAASHRVSASHGGFAAAKQGQSQAAHERAQRRVAPQRFHNDGEFLRVLAQNPCAAFGALMAQKVIRATR
ncbi:hypothetical protein [Rhodovulum sp. ES.010]|uniref:hypothetical protein n=1 Tax=Rhodovulum sp. ES.010 TaxID=1882821 RepID=UPI0011151A6A|nr:hypothetical protein [Rhodovulum sp. ES.010]